MFVGIEHGGSVVIGVIVVGESVVGVVFVVVGV